MKDKILNVLKDNYSPYIKAHFLEFRINEYEEIFRKQNGGKNPTQDNINVFTMLLVSNNNINNEVDEFINKTVEKIFCLLKEKRNSKFIIDSTMFLTVLTTLAVSLAFISNILFKLNFSLDFFTTWTFFISSIASILFIVILYIKNYS